MHRWIALALPLALLAGCGSGPDAACDFNLPAGTGTVHACVEFTNLGSADISAADDACAKNGGKAIDACSTENVLGFCDLSQQGVDAVEYFYTGNGVTVDIAKQACEGTGKGTWTTK
jgi:hypothetical protein